MKTLHISDLSAIREAAREFIGDMKTYLVLR